MSIMLKMMVTMLIYLVPEDLFLSLWHLSGHLPSEVFVNGIMYAGTGVGCKPDAACHGVFPLCFGKVWQTGTADAIAYQSVNESGIEVVTGSDGAYRAHGWYRKTGTPFWGAQHDVFAPQVQRNNGQ